MTSLVTVGVVSYNRLNYLRALMESARECLDHPHLQWVVVDGASSEPGLREYLASLDFVDELVVEPCTHAAAMNTIVERAAGDFLLLLPEDIQFIARGPWLGDLVEAARRPGVGHITFDAQRRATIRRRFAERRLAVGGRPLPVRSPWRSWRTLTTSSGALFAGYGHTVPPVIGSGIMSFVRTEIWRRLGPWRERRELATPDDSGLGAEGDMDERVRRARLGLESFLLAVPVAADIITDPRGTKARIRQGNRRYGRYAPPPEPPLYYRIHDLADLRGRFGGIEPAAPFEDVVEPLGWELPLDEHGDLMKASVIGEDEPYELV